MNRTLLFLMPAALLAASPCARADEISDQINALKKQIETLSEKVRVLEQQHAGDLRGSETSADDKPEIVIGSSGLSVRSADSNFVFQFHGLVQVDNRTFFDDGGIQGNDTFLLRRARPIFSGTLYRDFEFLLVPDFAGSSAQIFDAYLNYRHHPSLQLRAGKFKVPAGLEQLQSDPVTSFNERALPNNLVPNRDIGFQLWGNIGEGLVSYAVGVFNGVGDGRSTSNVDFEDHREFAGRIFIQPFRNSDTAALHGFGLGVGGTWGTITSDAAGLPNGFMTDGLQRFFTYTNGVTASGTHWRVSPQAYYYSGPFSLLGEYVVSAQRVAKGPASATPRHTAWQISSGWILTGEDASYTGVVPRRPFDPSTRHWGALQLVGRYSELDVDNDVFPLFADPGTSATEARAWAVGLNWYLNRNLRFNTSFSRTTFSGGDSGRATVTRQPEEVLFTRMQLVF